MKTSPDSPAPEQYELHEKTLPIPRVTRRTFFQVMGSGLAVAFSFGRSVAGELTAVDDAELSAWIHIAENNSVTVYTGKAEVGQNIRTSLAQIVAEELRVPFQSITMVMGDTALTPYDRGTFGSRSIPYMGPQLRKAAATAREVLLKKAATQMKLEASTLAAADGKVTSRDGKRSLTYGELARGEKLMYPVDEQVSLTPVAEWRIAGTSIPKVNGDSFLNGKHKYVSDMKLDNMLYGKILRAPAVGAKLISADTRRARQMEGVVVHEDGEFIGVAATTLSAARKALEAIDAKWSFDPQPSRANIFDYLRKNARVTELSAPGIDKIFEAAPVKVQQTFQIDYIAHVPLEPRAGIATWEGNQLTVWTGTQRPFGVQEDLAEVFSMPKQNIRVIQPDTGSGYGGKHTGEAGIEAARLARAFDKPVKVVWTREEEFMWAYLRPAGVIDVKASAGKDGKLTGWQFHNYNSGGSAIETPYVVSEKNIRFHPVESPLRQGSYRGLAATANNFAREAIMDDLAVSLKIDPLQFRLLNLAEPRMKGVLEAAADKFGWTSFKPSKGRGAGIACGTEKASFVATVAEVTVNNNGVIKVERVVCTFECGAIINPEHLKNQIQGSVVQGLGGALFEKIDFKDGRLLNASMSKYRVPRFSDMPVLEIVMLNRKDIAPAGAGETPIIAIAPAIRNAVLQATGKKLYTLPLMP